MAGTQVQFRRGTTTQHSTFTGAEGEVTVDTTKDTAVVHDGTTAGGRPLLREDLANNTNVVTLTGTQTLTNKTITGTKETVYAITDGAAFEVDPANGGVQTITLGANRTPKGTNFAAGQSVTLMVDDGSAYTLTWTDTTFGTSGVKWVGGSAPALPTTGYAVIVLWKVGTQVYGKSVGNA